MDDNGSAFPFTARQSVLPLKLTMSEVCEYLGLGGVLTCEAQLIIRINQDDIPIRLNINKTSIAHNCIIKSIELYDEAYLQFDNKRKYKQHNTYKILEVIDVVA